MFMLTVKISANAVIGPKVFTVAQETAEGLFRMALAENGLTIPDVDFHWPCDYYSLDINDDLRGGTLYFATRSRPPLKPDRRAIMRAH